MLSVGIDVNRVTIMVLLFICMCDGCLAWWSYWLALMSTWLWHVLVEEMDSRYVMLIEDATVVGGWIVDMGVAYASTCV